MRTYIIIDDEPLIRKGTRKKLQAMEDRVTCIGEAGEGREGISLIEEKNPDFVILDMQMPGMNGTELLPYLAENYPELPMIVISGFRNFDYIKQAITSNAIDYLLKPFSKEAIQECVQQAIDRLDNNQTISRQITDSYEQKEAAYYEYDIQYLTNLILGYHTGDTSISSEKLKFVTNIHKLVLLTLFFDSQPSEFYIQEWLEECDFGNLVLQLSTPNTPHLIFLVLFIPNDSAVRIHNMLQQITDALLTRARHMDLSLLIGISHSHHELKELHTAFEETSAALNQQLLNAPALCSYTYQKDTDPRTFIWNQEDEFLFRVEAGMADEVRELTIDLFRQFHSVPGFTLTDAKYYCYYLSNQCGNILNYYLNQNNPKTSNSIQNVVNHIFNLEELKEYYLQFFLNITEMLKPQSIYALDDIIEKIKVYIRHNFQKNLTQDFIASLFYLNRSYLSTLFKQKTGIKFVDYLNDIRIEKSKELLTGTAQKTYQISKAVGYDNPKYFFRIFKKKTGITPEQFRILHQ